MACKGEEEDPLNNRSLVQFLGCELAGYKSPTSS